MGSLLRFSPPLPLRPTSHVIIAVYAPVYNLIVQLFVAPLGIVVGPDYCLPFRSQKRDREVENEGTHCYFVGLVIVCACT